MYPKSNLTILILLLGLMVITVACQPLTTPQATSPPASPTQLIPSQSPTTLPTSASPPTATSEHSATPRTSATAFATSTRAPTATPAPLLLPGVPGFQPTPTFDASSLQTATPGAPPPCPVVDPSLTLPEDLLKVLNEPEHRNDLDSDLYALEFLNQGGSPEVLIQAIEDVDTEWVDLVDQQDLNNDGQAELLLKIRSLSILGCDPNGSAQYKIFGRYDDNIWDCPPWIEAIRDLNQNGFPELVLTSTAFSGFSTMKLLEVIEWDGHRFQTVFGPPPEYPYRSIASLDDWGVGYLLGELRTYEFKDLDGNGTLEIIVESGLPGHPDSIAHGPWRRGYDIFTWNGEGFVLQSSQLNPPEYRFQAVHDADYATLLGKYDDALNFYQEAIFSDQLAGWSPELFSQQRDLLDSIYSGEPTPIPYPAPAEEYYQLAAYARFRILLLHTLLGNQVEAQTVYDTLQNKFPEGQPGHASALFAQAFWQAFQDTQDVGQACRLALETAADQTEEIIHWLSGFHGYQSPRYQPVDLCPFGQSEAP